MIVCSTHKRSDPPPTHTLTQSHSLRACTCIVRSWTTRGPRSSGRLSLSGQLSWQCLAASGSYFSGPSCRKKRTRTTTTKRAIWATCRPHLSLSRSDTSPSASKRSSAAAVPLRSTKSLRRCSAPSATPRAMGSLCTNRRRATGPAGRRP